VPSIIFIGLVPFRLLFFDFDFEFTPRNVLYYYIIETELLEKEGKYVQ